MTSLRRKMIDAMQVRGFSVRTHRSYLEPVANLAQYYHRSPDQLRERLIRRFLLHILPQGFMRIRHFDFLANRCRNIKLAQIRAVLETTEATEPDPAESESKRSRTGEIPAPFCPCCQQGRCWGSMNSRRGARLMVE